MCLNLVLIDGVYPKPQLRALAASKMMVSASAVRNAALVEVAKKPPHPLQWTPQRKTPGFGVSLLKAKGSKSLLCIVAPGKTQMLEDDLSTESKQLYCLSKSVSH